MQKALLLHLVGPETQDIYDTVTPARTSFEDALTALSTHFEPMKNVTFERSAFHRTTQHQMKQLNNMSQDLNHYHFTVNMVQKQRTTLEIK